MKKIFLSLLVALGLVTTAFASTSIFTTQQGGTGTSTATANYLLIGKTDGSGWTQIATSSLGISGSGGGTWGSITGTLSSQTDLQNALNTKLSTTTASITYPNFTYASSTYYFASNPSNYIDITALLPYLSTTTASTLYPTFTYASSTYLTASSLIPYLSTTTAASTYYLQTNPSGYISSTTNALTNYPTYTYASSTYLTSSSLLPYITTATATSSFPSFTYASSTFATISSLSAYLSTTTASTTYAKLAGSVFTGPVQTTSSLAVGSTTAPLSGIAWFNGNVGINAANPGAYALFVQGNTNLNGTVAATNLSGTNSGDVTLANTTNGLTISSQALTMAVAGASATGTISNYAQTIAGAKTFTGTTTLATTTSTNLTVNGSISETNNIIPVPATTLTATGDIIAGTLASSTAMDLVFLVNATGYWSTANANASTTASSTGMLGLNTTTGQNASSTNILLRGIARNDSWAFATGTTLYVGTTTSGTITANSPTGSGNVNRVVGYALTQTTIWFDPSKEWVTF